LLSYDKSEENAENSWLKIQVCIFVEAQLLNVRNPNS
jgi:hypothetical protein